ncbi:Protein of unknown function [Fulvimarina manganoxydans]|uniref:DUF3309 domain-containing protein n=1 Tax=Fulvimarina manganoxydans TaxID=937218 RepID=A0A1W2A381_9HYPH|nr:DUF3309 family protein [Fulvimarina manganoxydans]MCK5931135.1 DUF3309 family protein [Fulvimarina manganoxydans]MEE2951957.1 DUF3309 family protein [Pseudomonadota bacterium]SMC55033.1 Protein of unknown function [Fulvimarina manganoxydans]
MSTGGFLFLVLLIALIVALPIWPFSRRWTIGPTMIIGLLLVLVLVLILIGTI